MFLVLWKFDTKAVDTKLKFMWNVTLAICQMNIEINNKTTDVLAGKKSNYNDNTKLLISIYCHVEGFWSTCNSN